MTGAMMLQVAALWTALFVLASASSVDTNGVNFWADPQSFEAKVQSPSLSEAVHGKENMVLSTYRQRLLNMGQPLGSMVALPPTTPAPATIDTELLKGEIKATLREGEGFSVGEGFNVGSAAAETSMKATEKATEDNVLGMASLKEDIERAYSDSQSPAPAPTQAENPFWKQNYNPRGRRSMLSIKQQFANAGDVFTRYQQKLRGTPVQESAPKDASYNQPERASTDTLLGIAAAPAENALMQQEARDLAHSFESAATHPIQTEGTLPFNVPDSALGLGNGELTQAEKQRWEQMTQPAPVHDASQDYPFVPALAAHVDPPPPIPETPLGPMPKARIPNLWDPPSQASEEIAMAHGQSANQQTDRGRIQDLWRPHSDGLVASLQNEGIEIPTSKKQWGDVFNRYKSSIHDRLDADNAALDTGLDRAQSRPQTLHEGLEPRSQLDDQQKFKFAASLFSPLPSGTLNNVNAGNAEGMDMPQSQGQNPFAALPPSQQLPAAFREPKQMPKTWNIDGPLYDTHWKPAISLSQLTDEPTKVAKKAEADALVLPAKGETGLTQLKKMPFQVEDRKVDAQDKQLQDVLADLPEDPIETQKPRTAVTSKELWEAPAPSLQHPAALPQIRSRAAQDVPPAFKSLLSRPLDDAWAPPPVPDILKQEHVEGSGEHQRPAVTRSQLWGSEPMVSSAPLQPRAFPALHLPAEPSSGAFPPLHLPTTGQLEPPSGAFPPLHIPTIGQSEPAQPPIQQQMLPVVPEAPQPPPAQNSDSIDDPAMDNDGMEPAAPPPLRSSPPTQLAAPPPAPVQLATSPSGLATSPSQEARSRLPTELQPPRAMADLQPPKATAQVFPPSLSSQPQESDETAIVTPTQAAAVLWGAFTAKPSTHQTARTNPSSPLPTELKSEFKSAAERAPVSLHVADNQAGPDSDVVTPLARGTTTSSGVDCSGPDPPPPCPWIAPELGR